MSRERKDLFVVKKVVLVVVAAGVVSLFGAGTAAASFGDPVEGSTWGAPVTEQPEWGSGPTVGFGAPKCYGVYVPNFGCW